MSNIGEGLVPGSQREKYRDFDYFGAHSEGGEFVFRVFAPSAEGAHLVGSFNGYSDRHPMKPVGGGVFEARAAAEYGDSYKFRLTRQGKTFDKADPYAFFCERPPATASRLYDLSSYNWRDAGWLEHRKKTMDRDRFYSQPINIYEIHAGSWKKKDGGAFLSYTELADELAPYVKQMGYTHIELMPIMEYPYDPSWGYQICGYYATTSRFGSPSDFMAFVDIMHEAGVGVILDWVPGHFPKDEHGLFEFDGSPLYEYSELSQREHRGWGTNRFDVGREEVASFLISNALFWAEKYHIDGLRVDAVASMLYLDYDKREGEWLPNKYGDNRCLEAVDFFKKLNRVMGERFPDVLIFAEESSAWPRVTGSLEEGGLGFSFKWNMGWMNDTLNYLSLPDSERKNKHGLLTFSLTYAFFEKFLLPLSHDEVVHCKGSIVGRVRGEYRQKFAAARAYAVYMMTHPGKKLNFMGNEIGQFREWDWAGEIEWFLLDYPQHASFQLFHSELNHLYLARPELWEVDDGWEGFRWIDPDNREESVYSYRRIARGGSELVVVINFSSQIRADFLLGVPRGTHYIELINSDAQKYGGGGIVNPGKIHPRRRSANGLPFSLKLTLAPLSALILKSGGARASLGDIGKVRRKREASPLRLRAKNN